MIKRIIIGIFLVTIIFSTSVLSTQNASAQVIPDWVKNTAKWYGEGLISQHEFIEAVEYLLENNIIILDPADKLTTKDKIIIEQSEHYDKLIEKGVEQLKFGDNEDAIIYFDEALKRNPDNVKALVDKGIAKAR